MVNHLLERSPTWIGHQSRAHTGAPALKTYALFSGRYSATPRSARKAGRMGRLTHGESVKHVHLPPCLRVDRTKVARHGRGWLERSVFSRLVGGWEMKSSLTGACSASDNVGKVKLVLLIKYFPSRLHSNTRIHSRSPFRFSTRILSCLLEPSTILRYLP